MKIALLAAAASLAVLGSMSASAVPVAATGYTISAFGTAPAGTSGADSVVQVGGNVYVGYSNGTPKDGSAGFSTIVEYDARGNVVNSTQVAGHTDGLRYDPTSKKLWSMQNEDGNPNLVLVTPGSLAKSQTYSYSSVPHGGGYDDVAFYNGQAFVTASNPGKNPNTDFALSLATLGNGIVNLTGVLAGNASAKPIGPQSPSTLNLQDPDSLTVIPGFGVLLDSQADGVLVLVGNPGGSVAPVGALQLANGVTVDDSVYNLPGAATKTLLVADKTTNTVYAISGRFDKSLYSAAQDAGLSGFVGGLNGTDGTYTPIATGLGNPGGEQFLVPEPASLGLAALGLVGLAALRRRRA